MNTVEFVLRGKVWLYPGMAGWHFVTVSKEASRGIKEMFSEISGGFGSIPVRVTVGETHWETSIFPDKQSGAYILPIKAAVRKKEGIVEGTRLVYAIEILA